MGERAHRVRETRFGDWFLSTRIWLSYVLASAVTELDSLLGERSRSFPSILDIGCGRGQAFRLLDERFRPDVLFGIDVNPRMVDRAVEAAGSCSCRVELRTGDVARLELPDSSLDMVFCHQTLHHVPDQEAALRELHRVLKPGGVLLLAESCRRFIHSLPVRMLFRHPMDVQKSGDAYLELLWATGFVFDASNVSNPHPWWSRPDLGIAELIGRGVPAQPEPTLVHVAAFRPARSGSLI